jgi:hypothetical protein
MAIEAIDQTDNPFRTQTLIKWTFSDEKNIRRNNNVRKGDTQKLRLKLTFSHTKTRDLADLKG